MIVTILEKSRSISSHQSLREAMKRVKCGNSTQRHFKEVTPREQPFYCAKRVGPKTHRHTYNLKKAVLSVRMTTPFGRLNGDAVDQVQKYLRFFRQKKDALVRTVMRELDVMKNDRLEHDEHMFSKEDLEEFAANVIGCVRGYMNGELGTILNMGALSVSQLLESAQDKGCDLELEVAAIENVALLEAVEKFSLDAIPKARSKGLGQLTSLKDQARAQKEAQDNLEEENGKLREEVAALTRKLAIARRSKAEGKESEEALEEALREAKEENDKRVRDTNQFLTMKKLMQSQASNIRELRRRLEQYEPSDTADSKDDD
jgi:hypothetical protein